MAGQSTRSAALPTLTAVAAILLAAAQRRVPDAARGWFEGVSVAAGPALDPDVVAAAFGEAPRRFGRARVGWTADERGTLAARGITWPLETWRVDDLARVAWLAAVAARGPAPALEALVEAAYHGGDAGARGAVLRALPLLPDGGRFVALALEACRAATRPVLEAIACDNPFAATHFHELHFDDLVIRAATADLPIGRIVGLERRLTPELVRRARRLAAERRAAGRAAPADLERITGDRRTVA